MGQREFNKAIADGARRLHEREVADNQIRQLNQDIADLMSYLGEVVRGPCGHLRVVGFVCPCRQDHSS